MSILTKKRIGVAIGVLAGLGLAYLLALYLILYVAEPDFSPFFEAMERVNDQARGTAQEAIGESELEEQPQE
jgi:hypothetical protein